MSVKQLTEGLRNPSGEFSPVPFWFFNDKPDKDRIKEQLADYVEKGVNGLVLHPRIGIPGEIPYLSDAYFQVVKYVVETAAELHMKVVLYDEGMYPSGSAHGMVAAANPEFAARGITITGEPGEDRVLTELPGGRYLVLRKTGGTIRGIHFGEDDGEDGAPAAADILNPEAVKLFIRLTHDRYYEELKAYFGNTIIGFFTDEPCALGRNAEGFREWAEGMEREIAEAGGRLSDLEGLFTGEENVTTGIYRKLIKKHLRENFYKALHDWCEDHGIWLMGHPAESDDVEEELYFHVPGQDLIMRRVSPESGGLLESDSVQAKLAADIARHLGRRRNSNECFGVCCREQIPWYFTGKDMKWYLNWMGIRGVNLFIPHAFYYSVEGKRKEERPPDVGPNNIWWKHYRQFSDYMKRISYLMTDSVNGARVAVLCDNNRIPYREIACFYENQIEFNYLPAALLKKCRRETSVCAGLGETQPETALPGDAVLPGDAASPARNVLCIEGYRYEAVLNVLGEEYDSQLCGAAVYHKAEELLTEGFRAVHTAQPCPSLRTAHIYKEETEILLLSNEGDESIRTKLQLPGDRGIVFYDLWKNRFYSPDVACGEGGKSLEIELTPCEMTAVIFDGGEDAGEMKSGREPEKLTSAGSMADDGGKGKGAESPELAGKRRGEAPDWSGLFIRESKKDNQAVYSYSYYKENVTSNEIFEVDGEEMAECYCNESFAGVSFFAPHRFEIGSFLKEGENEIKLVFTGNAANKYDNAGLFYGLRREEGK